MAWRDWARRALGATDDGERTRGAPPSGNGASSFHLRWAGDVELSEAWATLEVVDPPSVPRLYFWALQVSFGRPGRAEGAAHLGLQHHPGHPGQRAVNWGGYGPDGSLLDGSPSALPCGRDDPNTRDLAWRAGTPYRLWIHRSPQRGWRGTVTDVASGAGVVVRDLWAGGEVLHGAVVWSEVFARCDDPGVAVRWSDLGGRDRAGRVVPVREVVASYQAHAAGGCANTTVEADGTGLVQRTGVPRTVPPGARLVVPPTRRPDNLR